MISNIKYVYDKNKENKTVLLGVRISLTDGEKTIKKEIYVGLPFALEDILENKINANLLGVNNGALFTKEYNSVAASGIIYFPQTDSYSFLEEGDDVILWNGEDKIEDMLEEAIEPYRELSMDELLANKLATMSKIQTKSLEYDNSLMELYDVNPVRQRYSSR